MDIASAVDVIRNSNRKYYVYCLLRLDNSEPFYIGVGTVKSAGRQRIEAHLRESNSGVLSHKCNVIRKCGGYFVEILSFHDDKQSAFDNEVCEISMLGRFDKGLGSLTNKTRGGEGGDLDLDDDSIARRLAGSKSKSPGKRVGGVISGMMRKNDPGYMENLQKIGGRALGIKMAERARSDPEWGEFRSRRLRDGRLKFGIDHPDIVSRNIKKAVEAGNIWKSANKDVLSENARRNRTLQKWESCNPDLVIARNIKTRISTAAAHSIKKEIRKRCIDLVTSYGLKVTLPSGRCGHSAWSDIEQSLIRMIDTNSSSEDDPSA